MKIKILLGLFVVVMFLLGTFLASALVTKQVPSTLMSSVAASDFNDILDPREAGQILDLVKIAEEDAKNAVSSVVDLEKVLETVNFHLDKDNPNVFYKVEITEEGLEIDVEISEEKEEKEMD